MNEDDKDTVDNTIHAEIQKFHAQQHKQQFPIPEIQVLPPEVEDEDLGKLN